MAKPGIYGGQFVKAGTDVDTDSLLEFIDEGKEVASDRFHYPAMTVTGKPHPKAGEPLIQFQIGVKLQDGKEKILNLNKTSYKALAEVWGIDTVNWIGKVARVSVVPLPTGGKMISLEAVTEK